MSLEIIKSGVLSLLQDYGRFGLQHYGITNSGPMDEHAFLWANKLLGNDFNAVQIEIGMGGFEARFTQDTKIAICGANLISTLNRSPIREWKTYTVRQGDIIRFSGAKEGLYTYLAVSGGFKVEPQLSSCSTVMRERLGGVNKNGDKLSAGDVLNYQHRIIKREGNVSPYSVITPEESIPRYTDKIRLRFVPNYSENGCKQLTLQKFTNQTYQVSNEINRMGYRLKGEALIQEKNTIISQGISTGFIQLPTDGQPIVLMKDRQTIGGYPLLGCIAHLDLAKLSQSKPGTEVSFVAVELEALENELIEHYHFFGIYH